MSTCAAADFSFFLVKTKSQGVVHGGGTASNMKGIYKLSMFILDSRPEEAPRVFVHTHTHFFQLFLYSHYLICILKIILSDHALVKDADHSFFASSPHPTHHPFVCALRRSPVEIEAQPKLYRQS